MSSEAIRRIGFTWTGELVGPDGAVLATGTDHNIIPQVGVDHLAGLIRGTTTPADGWYIGLGEGNAVPSRSIRAADLPDTVVECTAYSETSRPAWNSQYDGMAMLHNFESRAEFAFTADKRIHTGFLVSQADKGGDSGVLLSIARFQTPYDVPAGSTFRLGISISLLTEV